MMLTLIHFAAILEESSLNIPKADATTDRVQLGLQIFFGIAAAVALLIIAISALRMVIARGNSQDIVKARDAIVYASIGLAVTFTAFSIVTFVVNRV